jgi:hypothetical protein
MKRFLVVVSILGVVAGVARAQQAPPARSVDRFQAVAVPRAIGIERERDSAPSSGTTAGTIASAQPIAGRILTGSVRWPRG